MYQREGKSAYKADLSNTILLADYLDNPQRKFKSIHVAGTNGKGSTSHMLASVLHHAGYKVGLYTSPHLKDFRERIKLNGKPIPEEDVISFVDAHRDFFEENSLSFFEMTVGMAFDFFNREEVDIAVVEVGLGGRLDSTNIIIPEVAVITNIGLDHTEFLGVTLSDIAAEKAGIIKEGVPVVIGERHPDTQFVFEQFAEQEAAPIVFADTFKLPKITTDLRGEYQLENLRTAQIALIILQEKGWDISETAIESGMNSVVASTGLRGRWEVLSTKPKIICDTAHNREGLKVVIDQLQTETYSTLHIVLGMVKDKNLNEILPLFPKNAVYYFCRPNIPRGLDASILKNKADEIPLKGNVFESVKEAFESARSNARIEDLIFIGGSTFTVAEVL